MKIGVDITMLVYAGSGVANYTFNLVKNLLKADKKNEYRLFYSSFRRPKNFYYLKELKKLGGKIYDYRFPPTLLQLWWGKLHIIPIEWFTGKVDIFFLSDFLRPPLLPGTKGLTTIHDLTWKLFPKFHEEKIITAHEKKLEKTIKYKDEIIVDSKNTKQDLLRLYPQIEKNKVHVIYPGIGEEFKSKTKNQKLKIVLKKYGISYPSNFLFYVGAIEPRKNLLRSIEVFLELLKNKRYSDFNFLIAGRAGWKNEDVFQKVKNSRIENQVKFLGFIEDEDLPYFYSACAAFIYLSSYEGFGLPPVEAAACGKMTLMYNNSSLTEIFRPGYRYTKKGEEIKTLMEIIDGKYDVVKYRKNFSWPKYCKYFFKLALKILSR